MHRLVPSGPINVESLRAVLRKKKSQRFERDPWRISKEQSSSEVFLFLTVEKQTEETTRDVNLYKFLSDFHRPFIVKTFERHDRQGRMGEVSKLVYEALSTIDYKGLWTSRSARGVVPPYVESKSGGGRRCKRCNQALEPSSFFSITRPLDRNASIGSPYRTRRTPFCSWLPTRSLPRYADARTIEGWRSRSTLDPPMTGVGNSISSGLSNSCRVPLSNGSDPTVSPIRFIFRSGMKRRHMHIE